MRMRTSWKGEYINLPDFIVIGAMRCGTTTLYEYLRLHKSIGMSSVKETDFFLTSKNSADAISYGRNFQVKAKIYGEVSPNYSKTLSFPGVPERIHNLLPDCRIIYLVRDPVERAISQYNHGWLVGDLKTPPSEFKPNNRDWDLIIDASQYGKQIKRYINLFGTKNVLILEFNEFIQNPKLTLSKVASFLEIEDIWSTIDTPQSNASNHLTKIPSWYFKARKHPAAHMIKRIVPRKPALTIRDALFKFTKSEVPKLSNAHRQQLKDVIAPDIEELRLLCGQPFPDWSI